MKIIDKIKDLSTEETTLEKQNSLMKYSKKKIERKYNDLLERHEELSDKYTKLLEEKSNNFDMCKALVEERRELKKKNALAEETINELNSELLKATRKTDKLKKQIEGEKKNEI